MALTGDAYNQHGNDDRKENIKRKRKRKMDKLHKINNDSNPNNNEDIHN